MQVKKFLEQSIQSGKNARDSEYIDLPKMFEICSQIYFATIFKKNSFQA